MASANLFSREIKANKSPRNAFNVSYSTIFSSPVGQLLPNYIQEVKRGDKLKLGVSNLSRTAPLVTPAYMSFDEKTDFWFVPYRLIWSDYDNWRLGQTFRNRTTNLTDVGKQNYLPFTSFNSVKEFILQSNSAGQYASVSTALRYLDMLGYSTPNQAPMGTSEYSWTYIKDKDLDFDPDDRENLLVRCAEHYNQLAEVAPMNYFRLCAFQCVYMHGYRNEEFEALDPSFYNVDNLFADLNFDNSVLDSSVSSTPSYLAPRTLSPSQTALGKKIDIEKLFTPRFKNWRKDIFTAIKPDAGFNLDVTGLEIGLDTSADSSTYGSGFYWPTSDPGRDFPLDGTSTDDNVHRYNPLDKLGVEGFESDYNATRQDWTYQSNLKYGSTGNNPANVFQVLTQWNDPDSGNGFSLLYPQNIRNLMAQDKFSRSAIYADKDIASQIKALFGEEYTDPHKPVYLGSYSNGIEIADVTATAGGVSSDNSSSILGQLAGKVKQAGQDGKVFEKNFNDDGVVIGIHYIMPRNNYDSYRLNKFNTKISRFDYFYPQFDGLGYQPVLAYERNIPDAWSGEGIPSTAILNSNSLFGFAPRYYEYKQRTNEIHGAFMKNQPESFWTLSNNPQYIPNGSNRHNYKIYPTITNRIFANDYNGSVASDPFSHYYYFDATLISDMEIFGTPSL